MLVTLIGKQTIYKLVLPKIALGSYWISNKNGEKEKKLVNVFAKNGTWQIVSNKNMEIIDLKSINITKNAIKIPKPTSDVKSKVILEEYCMCGIYLKNTNSFFILYCSPVFDDSFLHLDIKTKEILIGSGNENDIIYNNKLVANSQARIFSNNGIWMIENLDTKFGTFVNNKAIGKKEKVLLNGDSIFIMGLKIIIMGNSLYINNPHNNLSLNPKCFELIIDKQNKVTNTIDAEENEELYSEEDYFFRAPRITNIIETEKVKIDSPPQIQNGEEMPFWLTMGSSLSMGIVMLISMFSTINGVTSGNAQFGDIISSVIITLVMLVGMILIPILSRRYEKGRKEKYEEKRQTRYKEYIRSKIEAIKKIMNKQRNILFENYPSAEECMNIMLDKSPRLWERKIEDYDFLSVRLGRGEAPLKIDIQYPEEQFTMDDDNLVEELYEMTDKSKTIKDAPIVMSLVEKNISAIIGKNDNRIQKFLQNLLIQLITFHSYEDLKLVFLLKEDKNKIWEYAKMLPHVWNNSKQIRFFADKYSDMEEISKYLEEELQNRLMYEEKNYKSFSPYYLIITDDYKRIGSLKIITEILNAKTNLGFSILCTTNDLIQLPNECKTFISIDDDKGQIFESEMSSNNFQKFSCDLSKTFYFDKISQVLSNIPIKSTVAGKMLLPNNYAFLEMYDVGKIEQLNILERWKNNDSTLSLQAPIGIDSTGRHIILDIHEKFHGPHGLIAGSTGSGKSEFIITYILSLAINYHPDDVTFILIDYKGGGLAGAFQKRDIKLPHLVGTITNIDTIGLQRSLASIQSELRRRQIIFNEARNMTDEGTIDIYKYQKMYHEGIVKKPVPHLLIICDEFAELKQQQEEFMEELISVSRIGRSLGVHLILATQKPAGVVNDQIRSNSKFAVCLKVQDREDSNDVIKRPDAASLKGVGQFYLQVGNNEYFVLGESAWAGAPYFPSDVTKKKVDTSIEVISNIGTVIKKADNSVQKLQSNKGEQLTNIVRYMHELAKSENIKAENLWLDSIPETIFIEQIREKYGVKSQKNVVDLIIGEYDDPANQRQGPVHLNLSKDGNTVIYGNAESGKETLLSSIVYDAITTYSSEEVWLYLLDFGTEALKIFKGAPHVGDIIFANDTEKIDRFLNMIQNEIKERKSILSNYNGDYKLYLNTTKKPMPMIVIMINNYAAFSEMYQDQYEDIISTLTREGTKCGIVFIITTSSTNEIRYRMTQNFKQKIALQLNNEDDFINIFDHLGKKRPAHIFGRGLITLEDNKIYEYQTAKICKAENWNVNIKNAIEKAKENNKLIAQNIPTIPNKVTYSNVQKELKDLSSIPVGINKKDLKICTYDFKNNFINIITAKNTEDATIFVSHIVEEIGQLKNIEITILNAEKIKQSKKSELNKDYNNYINQIDENLTQNNKHHLCIIIGLDKFLNYIDDGEDNFEQLLKQVDESGIYSFIIVDNATKLKNHEYDEWYKNYIAKEDGIWVGNGIEDQYLISISSEERRLANNCGNSFGYVVKKETPYLVKLLEMKEKGEEDE